MDDMYKLIVENLDEEIFVSDNKGQILFVNSRSVEINEFDANRVIGMNVRELVNEGYFTESSTLKVLEKNAPVSFLQTLRNNKNVIATGLPVYDENGQIEMVITTSKEIDAVHGLLDTLEKQEEEIVNLKHELSKNSDYDIIDPVSIKIKSGLEKLSSLDIPILIHGESGTGKQVAARHVHFSGIRRDKPFITINCTSSEDGFLEKELFGSEKKNSSGDSVFIKRGKLDFADEGTLVLNNISYLPSSLQKKVFDYIESGEFTRVGGVTPIKSRARIVATTGSDLKALSESGMFNKALYYRINTVPLRIPALRDRREDIPNLSRLYIQQCNAKYKNKKILSNNALGVLESHTWPGNLIELSQTIESAYIMTDGPVISRDIIYDIIYDNDQEPTNMQVICKDIIPLKEARYQLEEQLVKNAMDVYKTTYKAAEVLGVNQSTVARIMQKHR